MQNTLDLTGKLALVTGAGSGIGRAIVLRLAEAGMKLALSGRDAAKLMKTAALTGRPLDMLCLPADLTTPRGRADVMHILTGHFKRLDLLVNNAGEALSCPFEEITEAQYDRIMAINAKVPFLLCQQALPLLRRSDCPTIVNIGSVVAHDGYPLQAAYSASKHALLGMTQSLAKEVYREGIRVHILSPGGVLTDMIHDVRDDLAPEDLILPEEVAEQVWSLVAHRGGGVIDEIRMHRPGKAPFGK